ncbi:D-(-)-3-hydroxybutyrate oligomer hydrolase [Calidifontimicrobium sp. SYSU G02091]|uniref:D-(-)-3-hydroxybutyrate oligomer hydrolase n=1 Tax=Calidifontimicrobium sp. SYSU G02091 TaxID=2926421 RepID=UPI001F530A10|nr:D-(-)-3-hydroxybutyrate oligomer hydrolase [Calidifontimicrobium sp. SYSU G02091]MCI1190492.1 D-(-)-3-hydroxybutyrate oligomer hydrolase [Calidifontimicrobium sp. SYSU G02091]
MSPSVSLRARRATVTPVASLLVAAITALSSTGAVATPPGAKAKGLDRAPNIAPPWLGPVSVKHYDGDSDDLLTAGLGALGLLTGAGVPNPATAPSLSAAELRRLAIYNNYRAILDIAPAGGYLSLYGPNVGVDGVPTAGDGKIAGTEYLAYANAGGGRRNVTMMVQVPAGFDVRRPCIVTGTSSGSRGVYGAIGSSGEWGLKRGCAVAYTDKGTGNGVHDLQGHTVNLIDGVRADAAAAGSASNFTAALTDAERAAYNARTPNRLAVKHAHSQLNPEAEWGADTLRAIEFAFYVLNEQFAPALPSGKKARLLRPENTIVIASSVSNGAGAALAAAELDRHGLIDGVAVSEPQVQTAARSRAERAIVIQRGSGAPYTAGSRPLLDYFTYANLYQPCAALSARAAASLQPFPAAFLPLAQNRCASLRDLGLLAADTLAAQADEALDRLLAYGWEAETIPLHVSHWRFATPAIANTYANTYGRFSVADRLCGLSFAYFDPATGLPIAPPAALQGIFGTGNGVPPGAGIGIINDLNPDSLGGPVLETLSYSTSTGRFDLNVDGARCQRELVVGSGPAAERVRKGIAQVQQRGRLNGKPTIIVHGRADTLVPVNFSSRPYAAQSWLADGAASRLSYIEVTNAQHFDAFLPFPDYAARYVPLHVYFNRALDAMWAHLAEGAPLPPSQVVRTTPRGDAAVPITAANVPPWSAAPAAGDRITFDGRTMRIPD